ncbi:hypothetical protein SNEBB_002569 [Seison nebaliae]|nr:hypothetical protein SNEBB_002569 [Seison nebaliae]
MSGTKSQKFLIPNVVLRNKKKNESSQSSRYHDRSRQLVKGIEKELLEENNSTVVLQLNEEKKEGKNEDKKRIIETELDETQTTNQYVDIHDFSEAVQDSKIEFCNDLLETGDYVNVNYANDKQFLECITSTTYSITTSLHMAEEQAGECSNLFSTTIYSTVSLSQPPTVNDNNYEYCVDWSKLPKVIPTTNGEIQNFIAKNRMVNDESIICTRTNVNERNLNECEVEYMNNENCERIIPLNDNILNRTIYSNSTEKESHSENEYNRLYSLNNNSHQYRMREMTGKNVEKKVDLYENIPTTKEQTITSFSTDPKITMNFRNRKIDQKSSFSAIPQRPPLPNRRYHRNEAQQPHMPIESSKKLENIFITSAMLFQEQEQKINVASINRSDGLQNNSSLDPNEESFDSKHISSNMSDKENETILPLRKQRRSLSPADVQRLRLFWEANGTEVFILPSEVLVHILTLNKLDPLDKSSYHQWKLSSTNRRHNKNVSMKKKIITIEGSLILLLQTGASKTRPFTAFHIIIADPSTAFPLLDVELTSRTAIEKCTNEFLGKFRKIDNNFDLTSQEFIEMMDGNEMKLEDFSAKFLIRLPRLEKGERIMYNIPVCLLMQDENTVSILLNAQRKLLQKFGGLMANGHLAMQMEHIRTLNGTFAIMISQKTFEKKERPRSISNSKDLLDKKYVDNIIEVKRVRDGSDAIDVMKTMKNRSRSMTSIVRNGLRNKSNHQTTPSSNPPNKIVRLNKSDISRPCAFDHITKMSEVNYNPIKNNETPESLYERGYGYRNSSNKLELNTINDEYEKAKLRIFQKRPERKKSNFSRRNQTSYNKYVRQRYSTFNDSEDELNHLTYYKISGNKLDDRSTSHYDYCTERMSYSYCENKINEISEKPSLKSTMTMSTFVSIENNKMKRIVSDDKVRLLKRIRPDSLITNSSNFSANSSTSLSPSPNSSNASVTSMKNLKDLTSISSALPTMRYPKDIAGQLKKSCGNIIEMVKKS